MKNIFSFLFITTFTFNSLAQEENEFIPPVAKKQTRIESLHGIYNSDDYYWLKEKTNPEVINYLYAENAYADNMMRETRMLQKKLYDEFRGRMRETDESLPVKIDNYYYYSRQEKDKEYTIYCRKKDSLTAPEQIILDVNEIAKQYSYVAIQFTDVSPDHGTLAFSVNSYGGDAGTVYFKDLATDSLYKEEIQDVNGLVWANDNKTVFYIKSKPKNQRPTEIFRHVLHTPGESDKLIYEESNTLYLGLSKTSSERYILLSRSGMASNEIWYMDADSSGNTFAKYETIIPNVTYAIDHKEGDEFYIYTNWNAINFRLMKGAVKGGKSTWKDILPHQENVLLQGFIPAGDHLVIQALINGLSQVQVINTKTNESWFLKFPEEVYTVTIEEIEGDDTKFRYWYTSLVTPYKVYEYDIAAKKDSLVRDYSMSWYNPGLYSTERIWASGHDSVKIPIDLVYRKGLKQDGANPLYLYVYGSYGSNTPPEFSSFNLSYLDRGFVYAIAHVRGESLLGTQWHRNGKLLHKKNSYLDFISSAESLIEKGYTSKEKIVIQGGSAGGMLMGAVVTMRPDLFKAAIADVPFVDVLNEMMDTTWSNIIYHFDEIGNPFIKEHYEYISSYCPYQNIKAMNYPDLLVTSGYNDSRVPYWSPAKWVAKMRANKTDNNLLLFKTNMDGGHFGASGRYNGLKDNAFKMAFLMKSLGIKENYIEIQGKINDQFGDPLPYVNIVVSGTTKGTTSNEAGNFVITLKEDEPQELIFQSIGFKKHTEKINMNSRTNEMNIVLYSENVQLAQFTVTASARDPAYAIIKKAVDKRKYHLGRINSLTADLYIKSTTRLNEIPEKLPKFISKADLPDSNDIGLMYLSESVARYHYVHPDNKKEEMLASRVGGYGKGYSWNRASDVHFNFYENTVPISYYSDRPFVSPISATAMLYYKYKLSGSFLQDGKTINKIEVIPRRKGDPLFNGYIYIIEDDWQIHSLDLYLTKDAQIEWVDTVFIKENYVPVQDSIWMPLSVNMMSRIKVFGFDATNLTVGFFTNYYLNRGFPPKFFKNEVFKIEENANKKDTAFWGETRPFLLTTEENKYYYKADSLEKIKNSPAYKDSIAQKRNKITLGKVLLGGYSYYKDGYNGYNKRIGFSPLIQNVSFNTVEGAVAGFRTFFSVFSEETYNYTTIVPRFRYGFSNRHFNAMLDYYRRYDAKKLATYKVKGGKYVFHINENKPISDILNTNYTLLSEENYAKIFEKTFIKAENQVEVINGLIVNISAEFAHRVALKNSSNFKLRNIENREYTSNDPSPVAENGIAFKTHDVVIMGFEVVYRHKQKYENYPNRKIVLGSKYPEVFFSYKKGTSVSDATFNYDYIYGGVGDNMDMKTLGKFKYDVGIGTFFNTTGMNFIDYKHFNGSRTLFLTGISDYDWYNQGRKRLSNFHTLDYYTHSTNKTFLEVHAQQYFQGFWLSKFPLIRKLKWQEIFGFNAVYTSTNNFTELFVGVDNIFKVLRIDVATSYSKGDKLRPELRIGLSLGF